MADEYTHVETVGWFSRIGNSFLGVLLGIVLFFASFFVLFWNEGRVDFSAVAKNGVEISANAPSSAANGKLVSTTSAITSDEVLGDNLFFKPGKYIALHRRVEMYGWVEDQKTETRKNVGGSETKTTTYTYTKKWVDEPKDSSSFKHPEGHQNPSKSIKEGKYRVSTAKVGVYSLDMSSIDLPDLSTIELNNQNTISKDGFAIADDYLYKGTGKLQNPQVGDLRIQYSALPTGTNVTVFGKLDSNNRITPYIHSNNQRLYRIFTGTKEQAISNLKSEYTIFTWVFRLVGFLMMWIGLVMSVGPISVLLDFIPFLGDVSGAFAGASTFIIAFVLSAITILISMLLHNIVALAIAIFVAIGATIFLGKIKQSMTTI